MLYFIGFLLFLFLLSGFARYKAKRYGYVVQARHKYFKYLVSGFVFSSCLLIILVNRLTTYGDNQSNSSTSSSNPTLIKSDTFQLSNQEDSNHLINQEVLENLNLSETNKLKIKEEVNSSLPKNKEINLNTPDREYVPRFKTMDSIEMHPENNNELNYDFKVDSISNSNWVSSRNLDYVSLLEKRKFELVNARIADFNLRKLPYEHRIFTGIGKYSKQDTYPPFHRNFFIDLDPSSRPFNVGMSMFSYHKLLMENPTEYNQ